MQLIRLKHDPRKTISVTDLEETIGLLGHHMPRAQLQVQWGHWGEDIVRVTIGQIEEGMVVGLGMLCSTLQDYVLPVGTE